MPDAALPRDLDHRRATVNGIDMHYVEAGIGQAVLLLHGFPESWYSWRHQIAALAPYYHVVAPDQRGYNETERRPPYDSASLVADVMALADHVAPGQRFHLVGHDWGGAIGWSVAMEHGDRLLSWTSCNAPHPALFLRAMGRNPRQMLRSWYMLAFQVPWLPERLLAAGDYHRLARGLIRQCRPGTFTRDDIKTFLAGWRRQGLGGGVNWYRALLRHPARLPDPVPRVTTPTLVIWGEGDRFLGKELNDGLEEHVPDLRVRFLPGVSHWVQQEAPEEVNAFLLEHLKRSVDVATR